MPVPYLNLLPEIYFACTNKVFRQTTASIKVRKSRVFDRESYIFRARSKYECIFSAERIKADRIVTICQTDP